MKKDVTADRTLISDILSRAEVLHLALVTAEGPYSVPVNFAHEQDAQGNIVLFIHSGMQGTKAGALAGRPGCSFSTVAERALKSADSACAFGYRFRSVMGSGTARFLEGDDRMHGLSVIMGKYAGNDDFPYNEKALEITAVIAINVTQATARIKGF